MEEKIKYIILVLCGIVAGFIFSFVFISHSQVDYPKEIIKCSVHFSGEEGIRDESLYNGTFYSWEEVFYFKDFLKESAKYSYDYLFIQCNSKNTQSNFKDPWDNPLGFSGEQLNERGLD